MNSKITRLRLCHFQNTKVPEVVHMQIADGRSYLCCDLAIVEDLRSVSAEQQGSVLEVYFTERECQQSFRNTAVSESTDAV